MNAPIDPSTLFRKRAMQYYVSGEDTHELLVVVPSYTRWAFIYLGALLGLFALWLFLGAVTVEIKGKGIFMSKGGVLGIEAQMSGFIKKILVKPGDFVKKGDPVALIYDIKQEIALRSSRALLVDLEKDYTLLKKQIESEEQELTMSLREQIGFNRTKLNKLEETLPGLEQDYEKKKRLLEEGLMSSSSVLDAKKIVLQSQLALEVTKSTIFTLKAQLKKSYRIEELQALEQRILEEREKEKLLALNRQYIQLYSPLDARIIEVLAKEGDSVTIGRRILWIEAGAQEMNAHTNMIVYGFVDGEMGKRIATGKLILVEPSTVNAQEFGSLVGEIIDISPYMVSAEELKTLIHSEGLIDYLTSGISNPYLVTIQPLLAPSSPSGFKWTSGEGPPLLITTGTVCTMTGIAYYERPIVRIFPVWWSDRIENNIRSWFPQ